MRFRLQNPLTKFKPKKRSRREMVAYGYARDFALTNFPEVMEMAIRAEASLLSYLLNEHLTSEPILVCGRPFQLVWELEPQPITIRWVEDRLT